MRHERSGLGHRRSGWGAWDWGELREIGAVALEIGARRERSDGDGGDWGKVPEIGGSARDRGGVPEIGLGVPENVVGRLGLG